MGTHPTLRPLDEPGGDAPRRTAALHRECAFCAGTAVTACGRCGLPLCGQHDRSDEHLRCDHCEVEFRRADRRLHCYDGLLAGLGYLAGAVLPWLALLPLVDHFDSALAAAVVFLTSFTAGSEGARRLIRAAHRAHRNRFLDQHTAPVPPARVVRRLPGG